MPSFEDPPLGDEQEAEQEATRVAAKAKPETLEVAVVAPIPAMKLVMADSGFLATLRAVEAQIAALAITDAASAQVAADLQIRLTTAGAKLEKTRKELVDPFLTQQRAINAAAEGPKARIVAAIGTLKTAQSNYAAEQQRIAAENERKRLAEIKRLEDIALAEREAEQRRLDEIERQAEEARVAAVVANPTAEVEPEWDEQVAPGPVELTATELAIEKLRYAPTPVVAKPIGVSMRTTLVPEVFNVDLLPSMFVIRTANLPALRSTYCTGWTEERPIPECPGVRFIKKTEPVPIGRSKF